MKGVSGLTHQYDCIFLRKLYMKGRKDLLFVECKWHDPSISVNSRNDIMIFNQKALDVYHKLRNEGRNIDLYRVFVTSIPLQIDDIKLCFTNGILPIYPIDNEKKIEPLEVIINRMERLLQVYPYKRQHERSRLLELMYDLREKIFWGCNSYAKRRLFEGGLLMDKYREVAARAGFEVAE